MNGHNHPKQYTVAGVAYDVWNGNEDTVYEPTWFIQKDGGHFYCPRSGTAWKETDLKKISPMDEDYVRWFAEDESIGINEGENLYLAGHLFIANMDSLIKMNLVDFSFHAWESVGEGKYFAHAMTRPAYNAFVRSLSTQTWLIVEDYLRAGEETVPEHVLTAFNSYCALYDEDADDHQRHVRRGAFYLSSGNMKQFAIEAYFATVGMDRSSSAVTDFKAEVKNLLQMLRG